MREAFAARPATAAAGHDCPEPGRIWDAVRGQLTAEERRTIVAGVAVCGRCAEAWRLARELAGDAAPATPSVPAPARPRWVLPAIATAALAAAVVLIVVLAGGGRAPRPSELRGGTGAAAIAPLVPDGAVLPRDAFELRWTAADPGSRYDLTLFTADLVPVYVAPELTTASHRVPPPALRGQAAGAVLYWSLDVRTPDGRRFTSQTFRVVVR
jgi:hypothetical protein